MCVHIRFIGQKSSRTFVACIQNLMWIVTYSYIPFYFGRLSAFWSFYTYKIHPHSYMPLLSLTCWGGYGYLIPKYKQRYSFGRSFYYMYDIYISNCLKFEVSARRIRHWLGIYTIHVCIVYVGYTRKGCAVTISRFTCRILCKQTESLTPIVIVHIHI